MVRTFVIVSILFDGMRALLLLFVFSTQFGFAQDELLDNVRRNIPFVFKTDTVCFAMFQAFESTDISGNNTLLGYKGAVELGMARHDSNPFKKMSFFSDGKKHLEEAIAKDHDNIELRFLRLTIQVHLPAFLGYSENVESDKAFVQNHLYEAKSEAFKTRVKNFIAHAEEQGKL